MQTNRLLVSLMVLVFTGLFVSAFLDSPTPALAQSVDSSFNGTNGISAVAVMTTTTPSPTHTPTMGPTNTATATVENTATPTATATGEAPATVTPTATMESTMTPTATGTPSSRDLYLALIYKAELPPTPTVTPTATATSTPQIECNAFSDDFSNPNSGWVTGENSAVRVQYVNGEYSFVAKQDGIFTLRSPADSYSTYRLETDIRWDGTLGDSFGIGFGIDPNFDTYYIFDLNTEFQAFRVLRIEGNSGSEVVPIQESTAIAAGNAVNHVEIDVTNGFQTYYINGQVVGTSSESIGAADVGVVVGANPSATNVDARFDNFCITVPQGVEGVNNRTSDTPLMKELTVPGFAE